MADPFTVSAQFFFIPRVGAMDDVESAFLGGLINWIKRVVNYAKTHHPYTDRTGTNTLSIGWAAIQAGKQIAGTLTGAARGDVLVPVTGGESIARGAGGRFVSMGGGSRPTVMIGTESNYGGYLELGTINMPPFPYLRPAQNALQGALVTDMTGVI